MTPEICGNLKDLVRLILSPDGSDLYTVTDIDLQSEARS